MLARKEEPQNLFKHILWSGEVIFHVGGFIDSLTLDGGLRPQTSLVIISHNNFFKCHNQQWPP